MNKSELITNVVARTGMKKVDATLCVDAILNTIIETLATGDKVHLTGFGTFEVKHRAARISHNLKGDQTLEISAHNAAAFKVGKTLREAVQKKEE